MNKITKDGAITVLRHIRQHVRINGGTGGNCDYSSDRRVCPRGLTYHFAKKIGVDDRGACTSPAFAGSVPDIVEKALDFTAPGGEIGDSNHGMTAETAWRNLEANKASKNDFVAHVDAAIRLVEEPESNNVEKLYELTSNKNFVTMSKDDLETFCREVRGVSVDIYTEGTKKHTGIFD